MAWTPRAGFIASKAAGSAISPPPSCKLSVRDFLFPFISLLRLIILRALLQAEKQATEEMVLHSLNSSGLPEQPEQTWPGQEDGGEQWGAAFPKSPGAEPQPQGWEICQGETRGESQQEGPSVTCCISPGFSCQESPPAELLASSPTPGTPLLSMALLWASWLSALLLCSVAQLL